MAIKLGDYEVRFARSLQERRQVRALRYKCFIEEDGASATEEQRKLREEWDAWDVFAKYLTVFHKDKVVGVYRIIDSKAAEKMGGFYSESEFDISKIKNSDRNIAEMSRACVDPAYREKNIVLRLLWMGLDEYIKKNKIDILFGMASWTGTNPEKSAHALSYLYHNHLSPLDLRTKIDTEKLAKDINPKLTKLNLLPKDKLDIKSVRREMSPLIKGYLNLNATIGDGVFIDKKFNSYEVLVVLQTADINPQYREMLLSLLKRRAH